MSLKQLKASVFTKIKRTKSKLASTLFQNVSGGTTPGLSKVLAAKKFARKATMVLRKKKEEFLEDDQLEMLQEQRMKMIYEFLGVKNIKLRSQQDCKEFSELIKDIKFLQKYCHRKDFPDICRHMTLEQCGPKTMIIQQGDAGDKASKFYIILKGQVGVYIDKAYDQLQNRKLEKVMVLFAGQAFGEMALLHDTKRTATIITEDECDLIVLDRKSFQKYIGDSQDNHLNEMIEFFTKCPIFKGIPKTSTFQLAASSTIHKLPSNTLLFHQGEQPSEFVFIKSGNFRLIRKIWFKLNPISQTISTDDFNEPSDLEKQYKYATQVLLELDCIGKNNVLCDWEIFNNNNRMNYGAMTSMPTTIIKIPNYSLKSILKGLLALKNMKATAKPYPPDQFIRQQFVEKQKWDLFKHQQIMNTLINKKNLKNDDVLRVQILNELNYELSFGVDKEDDHRTTGTLDSDDERRRGINIEAMKEGIEDWANREKILPSQRYRQDAVFENRSHAILKQASKGKELTAKEQKQGK